MCSGTIVSLGKYIPCGKFYIFLTFANLDWSRINFCSPDVIGTSGVNI